MTIIMSCVCTVSNMKKKPSNIPYATGMNSQTRNFRLNLEQI